ncbi:MAG: hypothetical protein Q9199_004058 [Rusavskia elegans]
MASSENTFCDLSRKPPTKCWSFNPWKKYPLYIPNPRYARHRHSPHRSLHPAQPSGSSTLLATPYAVPTIRLPATLTVPNPNPNTTNSSNRPTPTSNETTEIHHGLHPHRPKTRIPLPSPPIPLDTQAIEALWPQRKRIIHPPILPGITSILNPQSIENFTSTREAAFGVKISELEAESASLLEKAWGDVRPLLEEPGVILREKGGPFVLGAEVGYADFVVGSIVVFLEGAGV